MDETSSWLSFTGGHLPGGSEHRAVGGVGGVGGGGVGGCTAGTSGRAAWRASMPASSPPSTRVAERASDERTPAGVAPLAHSQPAPRGPRRRCRPEAGRERRPRPRAGGAGRRPPRPPPGRRAAWRSGRHGVAGVLDADRRGPDHEPHHVGALDAAGGGLPGIPPAGVDHHQAVEGPERGAPAVADRRHHRAPPRPHRPGASSAGSDGQHVDRLGPSSASPAPWGWRSSAAAWTRLGSAAVTVDSSRTSPPEGSSSTSSTARPPPHRPRPWRLPR